MEDGVRLGPWVVDIEPDYNDQVVRFTLEVDAGDAPTITLARLLGATLLSENKRHLPLATNDWFGVLSAVQAMEEARSGLESVAVVVGLPTQAIVLAAEALVRRVAAMHPLSALAIGLVAGFITASYLHGPAPDHWRRVRPVAKNIGVHLLQEWGRHSAAFQSTSSRVAQTRVPPAENADFRVSVASVLAETPILSAEEVGRVLRQRDLAHGSDLPRRVRALLRADPIFVEPARGRWTLGALLEQT